MRTIRRAARRRENERQDLKPRQGKARGGTAIPTRAAGQSDFAPSSLNPGLLSDGRSVSGPLDNPLTRNDGDTGGVRRNPNERPNTTGLPGGLKAGIERVSGVSLDDVTVHYDSAAPAGLGALAYAKGTDIHVAPGQARHLAHEAWHVIQQKEGRVRATSEVNGTGLNTDSGLEREADRMGTLAARGGGTGTPDAAHGGRPTNPATTSAAPSVVQPMLRFLGSVFSRAPKPKFPGLAPGSGRYPIRNLPVYKLEHKFSGYDINGSFDASPGRYSNVRINYIEKTNDSRGFERLFNDIVDASTQVGSRGVNVTFDQCKPSVVEKIEKYADRLGWNIIEHTEFDQEGNSRGTGPTIVLQKQVPPNPKQE